MWTQPFAAFGQVVRVGPLDDQNQSGWLFNSARGPLRLGSRTIGFDLTFRLSADIAPLPSSMRLAQSIDQLLEDQCAIVSWKP